MPWHTAPFHSSLPKLTPLAALDILVTAFLIYQFLMMVRGRRAAHVLAGIFVLLVLYLVSVNLGLEMLRGLLSTLAPYTAFAVIVMFQSEIRRALARLGRHRWLQWSSNLQRRDFAEEILLAMEYLSSKKTGALIVLERDMGLRTFVESGVAMDSIVSRDVLLAIFQPGGAMHDGAVIIQGDRLSAAACFLPLSVNPALASTMGTRHRAAIGITEDTDALALVVSEETGRISVVAFGAIESGLTASQVRTRLDRHFGWSGARAEPERVPDGLNDHGEETDHG